MENTKLHEPKRDPFTQRILAAALLVLCIGITIKLAFPYFTKTSEAQPLRKDMDSEVARLVGQVHAGESPTDKAMAMRNAIKNREYDEAQKIAVDVYAHSQMQGLRFYPFNEFVPAVADQHDAQFEDRLNEWIAKDKTSEMAYTIRSQYYSAKGSDIRGWALSWL